MEEQIESPKRIVEDYLINPPVSDGSKRVKDGVVEIIGNYSGLEFLLDDHAKAQCDKNERKLRILDYVAKRIWQNPDYIENICVSTFNNKANFSVSFKEGYTIDKSVEDIERKAKSFPDLKLGALCLDTWNIV
ncbi:MAG: hypothetical protein HRU18_01335 [Pseudoalteromonas sp.]|uniref:hypothetical protein n=1 Tax=Pseudoalteromonas sp. TaxID=53249 RepID=UPI001D804E95|nr:hypothetical protein [Pseudoalteromonas sp.]NRA76823.1 hypothetical protein [Pseudoalteromonas sp.]